MAITNTMGLMGMGQQSATTGRKKPLYLADYYKLYAQSFLNPYKELQSQKKADEATLAFEKETADKTAKLKEQEMSLYQAQSDKELAEAERSRLSTEALAKKQRNLTAEANEATRRQTDTQNMYSNIASGAGLAISGISAAKDLGYDVIGGVGSLLKQGLDVVSRWFGFP